MKEKIVLVDENDNAIGSCEKLEVHQKGILHRAFSVFIFNSKGELLLQKRANSKYHSAGLWTNTCCGHPRPGEDIKGAAGRRLKEEMSISCELFPAFNFTYNSKLENGLIENEFDHVLFGESNTDPMPDPLEASAWKFVNCDELRKELNDFPVKFTVWFRLCFEKMYKAKFG